MIMRNNSSTNGVLIVALLSILIISGTTACATADPVTDEPGNEIGNEGEFKTERIDSLFGELNYEDEPGLVAAVYKEGDLFYDNYQGVANLDHDIPLSDSTRFFMASLSKQFTAASAAVLIHRDSLGMQDYVADYLEDWPEWADEVKIQHLIYHTSGLPEVHDLVEVSDHNMSDPLELSDYLDLLMRAESLNHDPGESFEFTNSSYTTLAAIIEKISDKSLDEFAAEALFDPLGMDETHFQTSRLRVIPNRSLSYESRGGGFRQTYMNTYQGYGPDGLYTTIRDWEKWEQMRVDEDPLGKGEEFRQLLNSVGEKNNGDELNYGFGMYHHNWKGQNVMEHEGRFMGFRHSLRHFPEHEISVVVLGNRDDLNANGISEEISAYLLDESLQAWMEPYTGEYLNPELDVVYEFSTRDGRLFLNRPETEESVVSFEEEDKWSVGSWDFVFLRENDEIDRFKLSTGRARDVEFIRKNSTE